jgi:hypothetical protein
MGALCGMYEAIESGCAGLKVESVWARAQTGRTRPPASKSVRASGALKNFKVFPPEYAAIRDSTA